MGRMTANAEKLPAGEFTLLDEFVHMMVSGSADISRKESFWAMDVVSHRFHTCIINRVLNIKILNFIFLFNM